MKMCFYEEISMSLVLVSTCLHIYCILIVTAEKDKSLIFLCAMIDDCNDSPFIRVLQVAD